jgi:exo-beta-1,3-glucanase (GH17 family)
MGQNIVKSVKSLVSEANEVVNIMTVDEVKKILNKDDHVIVDLRDY